MSDLSAFESLGTVETPAATTTPANAEAAAAKKAKLEAMKQSLKETIREDDTFLKRLHTLSQSVEVINSLGYKDNGNIVVDKAETKDGKRALAVTSVIVGYRLKNVGDQPIPYKTEVWALGADGKYVAQKVEKVMAAGATADLTRQYMTMFCAQPEISFQLKNGKVIRGSGNKASKDNLKAELEAYYFSFDKETGLQINSDEVKLNVGQKDAEGNWTVKPEFVETFGFLNNVPEKTRGVKKEAGSKFNSSDLAANFVMQMLKDSAM